jgi:AcrR family transcriptional regulator
MNESNAGSPSESSTSRRQDSAQPSDPPWRPPAHGRSAPRVPLTRDAIVDAALAVMDREGVDGLSMRRVADELDTGAASLYWHVKNKDELLQLIFERTAQEVTLPPPDPSRWQEQIRTLAYDMRDGMRRHRDLARISLGRIPSGPTIARITEWTFELLRPVGIPDRVIAHAGDLFALYVGAVEFEQGLGLASPTGEDMSPEQIVGMLRDYILSLPQERYPHTRGAVDLLLNGDVDGRFAFGIDTLIRGIESYARDPGTDDATTLATPPAVE